MAKNWECGWKNLKRKAPFVKNGAFLTLDLGLCIVLGVTCRVLGRKYKLVGVLEISNTTPAEPPKLSTDTERSRR